MKAAKEKTIINEHVCASIKLLTKPSTGQICSVGNHLLTYDLTVYSGIHIWIKTEEQRDLIYRGDL